MADETCGSTLKGRNVTIEQDAKLDLSTQSLAELAGIVKRENSAAEEIARAAEEAIKAAIARVAEDAADPWILHAVRTGEALIEARKRVPQGQWYAWVESEAGIHRDAAGRYIRVATYRAELPPDFRGDRNQVLALLSGLPNATPLDMYSDEVKAEVRRLHAEGLPAKKILHKVGVHLSLTTIRDWTDPEYRARRQELQNQRRRAANEAKRAKAELTKKALLALEAKQERERRDAIAKRAGGDLGEVYSLLRKLTAAIERSATGAVNKDHSRALKAANHRLFQVEDEIVRIIGETS